MCGLVAIFGYMDNSPVVSEEEVRLIRDHMQMRGPDGYGEWFSPDNDVGLGHRRLSIFDLSDAGKQPMTFSSGDLQIVFNGAIYNFIDLREKLISRGYNFTSYTDTEVLLAGWREWQENLVDYLQGMFAFAIYDNEKKALFIARDPFGIKPLYYADDGKTIRLASQVKALVAGNPSLYSWDQIAEIGFQLWGSIQEPLTLFSEIKAFVPGTSSLIYKNGKRVTRTFMSVSKLVLEAYEKSISWNDDETTDRYREMLTSSVTKQLVADVPVGVFLSSGLDSNCLAALAQERQKNDFLALTLGFREYIGTTADETVLASKSASDIGCRHSVSWFTATDFNAHIDDFFASMDQPSIDGLNTWFVCKAAKEAGLKVAISGLGADEFLGGYPSFRQVPLLVKSLNKVAFLKGPPAKAINFLLRLLFRNTRYQKLSGLMEWGYNIRDAYFLKRAVNIPSTLRHSVDPIVIKDSLEYYSDQITSRPYIDLELNDDAQVAILESSLYMRNQLLRDSDWASMAHGIELRVPFIDPEVVLASSKAKKHTLLRCPKRALIDEVAYRPKTGFSVPVRSWMTAEKSTRDISIPSWANIVLQRFKDEKEDRYKH